MATYGSRWQAFDAHGTTVMNQAGGLVEVATWDFTKVTNHTLTGSGDIDDDLGAKIVGYNVFTQTGSPTQTFQVTDGTGLTWSRRAVNSTGGIAFDLVDVKALLGTNPWQTVWVIDAYFTSMTGSEVTNKTFCGLCLADVNNSISNNPNRGGRVMYDGTNWRRATREYVSSATNVNYSTLDGKPASGVGRLEVRGSSVTAGWQDDSVAVPGRLVAPAASAGSAAEVDGSMPLTPWTHLILWDNPLDNATANTYTLTKIVWWALGGIT